MIVHSFTIYVPEDGQPVYVEEIVNRGGADVRRHRVYPNESAFAVVRAMADHHHQAMGRMEAKKN